VVGLLALSGILASVVYLRAGVEKARALASEELNAIANLKAAQIATWKDERLSDARFLQRTRAMAVDVASLIARPRGASERDRLRNWLEPIRGGEPYESTAVYTPAGQALITVPDGMSAFPPKEAFERARASRDVVFADLYRTGQGDAVRFDILIPVFPAQRASQASGPMGIVLLRFDPNRLLYPTLKEWPVPSTTAETLLVRREGEDVVFLNELRHQKSTPLTRRSRPALDPYLDAALALREEAREVREGLDYRVEPVLATSRPIPGTDWVLVAKIDQAEAYGPMRRMVAQTAGIVALLILAVALGGGFVSRQKKASVLSRALLAEQERSVLAERLALLSRYANDIILLTTEEGKIVEANDRALAAYGYTLEELRALPGGGLGWPATSQKAEAPWSPVDPEGGVLFETLHQRRDGSSFPVEVSGRPVVLGGERYRLDVVRDITLRRKHEAEIGRLSRLHAAHSGVNQAILRAEGRDALLNDVCASLVHFGGFPLVWIGRADPETGLVRPLAQAGDASDYLKGLRVTVHEGPDGHGPTGTALREGRTVICNDVLANPLMAPWHDAARQAGLLASISIPLRRGGKVGASLTTYATEAGFFGQEEVNLLEEAALDIGIGLESIERETQRALTEKALHQSEERLRLALIAGHQGLFDQNVQTGEAEVSPEYATMIGYDPDTFRETDAAWSDRLHPDDRESATRIYADYVAGRRLDYRNEFRQRTLAGDWKWILSVGRIVEWAIDGRPLRMLGTHTDISDLKSAEIALAASEVRYRRLFESAKDGILILNASTGMVVDVNPFLVELLGYSREFLMEKAVWDLGFLRDIVANQESFAALQNQEYIRYEDKPLETADGRRIDVEFISNVYLVNNEKVIQCNIRDITERRQAEVAQLASLHEKEALLKEVHHRVKNNLQVITSLLRLETSRSAEPGTKTVLREMQGRIRSMALLHEALYRSGNFARVDLADYLHQLSSQLFRTQNAEPSRVLLVNDLQPSLVDIDQAIPCGLITNELLTNALKYAFADGRTGEVRLELRTASHGLVRLTVSDTGIGLPADFEERRGRSLGLQLVADLARQLSGGLEIDSGPGAKFSLSFIPHDPSPAPPPAHGGQPSVHA